MNFKDLKLGAKLGVGFGILIVIAVALGLMAVINMATITTESTKLAEEYVPEVRIANEMRGAANRVMYEMRGYGYTEDADFYNKAKQEMSALNNALSDADELEKTALNLKALKEQVNIAKAAISKYEGLAEETKTANENLEGYRAKMDEAAGKYMRNCNDFLTGQNDRMEKEIRSGNTNQDRLKKITIINDIIDVGNAVRVGNYKSQALRDPALFKEALNNFPKMDALFTSLRKYTRLEADLRYIDEIEVAANGYKTAMENFLEEWFKREELAEQREVAGREVIAATKATADAGIVNTQEIANEAVKTLNTSSMTMIIGLIFALIIGIAFAIFITRAISRPIIKGVEFANKLANGDLTATVDVYQKDEIGNLADALRNMVDKLREIVGAVIGSADNIASASEQMSSNSQQVSQGASEQASAAEEVSSSMEEMGSNIQQNTENAQQTEKISAKAATDITTGRDNVNQTVQQMKLIADKVSIISDIAFQTNILALNAAVEAARAGEHGKGFAVVAAEVRKLAERSQVAANEINDLSGTSVDIAEKSGNLLNEIVPDIQKTSKLVQEITAASLEQNSGADQINNAIGQLNQVTQQNAAASEEMATAAEELSSQADGLRDLISFFTIDTKRRKVAAVKSNKPKAKTSAPKKQTAKPVNSGDGVNLDLGSSVSDDDFENF